MKPRIRTYIDGFDDLLDGGIPQGHNVLIAGTPGTMKSSVAYSVLHNNAINNGTKGLYISLEQKRASLFDHMHSLGLDPTTVKDRVSVLDLSELRKKMQDAGEDVWIDFLTMYTKNIKNGFDYSLLVLDSLDAVEALAKFENFRMEFFKMLKWFKGLQLTTFIITEMPGVSSPLVSGPDLWNAFGKHKEDYLADGIILLKMEKRGDFEVQRRIRCVKMRSVRHDTRYFAIVFEGGRFQVTRIMA
ncbi:MAG: RAD55 family ATPase [Thermoplasmata archaeon]